MVDASFAGDSKDVCSGSGACWTYIKVWFKRFMYGMYPNEHIWRVNLAFIFLVVLAFVGFVTPQKYRNLLTLYYVVIYPIEIYLTAGKLDLLPNASNIPNGKQNIKQKKDTINVRDNPPHAPVSIHSKPK